jgi:hypothetical protein
VSKSAPPSQDYVGAAEATGQSSLANTAQQTLANRPDTNTPWGSQTWTTTPVIDPTTGQVVNSWSGQTTLNPDEQTALTAQQGIQSSQSQLAQQLEGQVQKDYSNPLDFSSVVPYAMAPNSTTAGISAPTLQSSINTSGVTTPISGSASMYDSDAANAAFQQYQNLNAPIQAQQKEQLTSQLKNEGLNEGDEAYDTAMKNYQTQTDQANQNATYQSILTGSQIGAQQQAADLAANNQEFGQANTEAGFNNASALSQLQAQLGLGTTQFSQALQSGNYQNALQQQQIGTMEGEQGYNLSQLNALLNGQQVQNPTQPTASTAGAAAPVNYSNAAAQSGQQALTAYEAQQQQQAGLEEGGMSLAALAAMFLM